MGKNTEFHQAVQEYKQAAQRFRDNVANLICMDVKTAFDRYYNHEIDLNQFIDSLQSKHEETVTDNYQIIQKFPATFDVYVAKQACKHIPRLFQNGRGEQIVRAYRQARDTMLGYQLKYQRYFPI